MKSYIPTYLKNQNRITVLNLFLEHQALTRTDISKATGISLPTVMKITDFLSSKDFLINDAEAISSSASGLGRKSQLLRLNESAYSAIGIYFEGSYLHIGLIDLGYNLIGEKTFPVSQTRLSEDALPAFSYKLLDAIAVLRREHPETTIIGVALALNGVVNSEKKQIFRFATHSFVDFYETFPAFQTLDIPLYIENDINAFSYGEHIVRRNPRNANLICLSLGTGFGSGIIINGNIWHGANYFAGEVGNIILSLPTFFSKADPKDFRIENKINLTILQEQFEFDINHPETCDNAKKKLLSQYISYYLVPVIYNLSYSLDISDFVLSGLTADFLGDQLFEHLKEVLSKLHSHNFPRPITNIMPSASKNSGVIGAAAIAFTNQLPQLLDQDE